MADGLRTSVVGSHARPSWFVVGVIDVKNYYLETADDVAERIDAVLATGVSPDRLTVVPDCGFSQTARWATKAKLRSLVAGRDLVLGRNQEEHA